MYAVAGTYLGRQPSNLWNQGYYLFLMTDSKLQNAVVSLKNPSNLNPLQMIIDIIYRRNHTVRLEALRPTDADEQLG